ncbi:biopolymer transporter ExbD [Meridianimarinicoccus sp. RP-17]|uniref:biopolymer transporter ExbD n=1 Tax=Meridianimarinicoccus zhengii TaxID=2056810 RepID=UPI000DAE6E78|nr:biopolymer transporter ExbD [Phycocomes zhengii]
MGIERRRRPARRIALTPLVDVIFLLLLFFMLSSTFSRFADIPLQTAQDGAVAPEGAPLFLSVGPDGLDLNGRAVASAEALPDAVAAVAPGTGATVLVLVSLGPEVKAQRLVDVLVVLRALPRVAVSLLV